MLRILQKEMKLASIIQMQVKQLHSIQHKLPRSVRRGNSYQPTRIIQDFPAHLQQIPFNSYMAATLAVMAACFITSGIVVPGASHAQISETCTHPDPTSDWSAVCIASLSPSPVREGDPLSISVRITRGAAVDNSSIIRSGIRVYDVDDVHLIMTMNRPRLSRFRPGSAT